MIAPSKRAATWLLDLLYPRQCGGCRQLGTWLCPACLGAMQPPAWEGWRCVVCQGPLVAGPGGAGCPDLCDGGGLSGVLATAAYGEPLSSAIQRLKYDNWRVLAGPLAALLTATVRAQSWPWGAAERPHLVPVPLHRRRERERGYNQSALLASALSAALGWPLLRGLVRVRYTAPQARLNADERAVNLEEAFVWQSPDPPPPGPLLLIDDVYTRGFTMNLCAEALRAARSGPVYGLALARAGAPVP